MTAATAISIIVLLNATKIINARAMNTTAPTRSSVSVCRSVRTIQAALTVIHATQTVTVFLSAETANLMTVKSAMTAKITAKQTVLTAKRVAKSAHRIAGKRTE